MTQAFNNEFTTSPVVSGRWRGAYMACASWWHEEFGAGTERNGNLACTVLVVSSCKAGAEEVFFLNEPFCWFADMAVRKFGA